jgi:1,4-alpha-glucan branching enzyme
MQRLVRDLNTLYRASPALHVKDCEPDGFQWIEANARTNPSSRGPAMAARGTPRRGPDQLHPG